MEENSPITNSENKPKDFWKEIFKLVILAVVIVFPFRLFIAQPFIVDGISMSPTFETGEYLIVDELSYHFKGPDRGSILIFKYPRDPNKYFIKRVIGLPGETVSIRNGKVSIINADNPEGFELNEPYVEFKSGDNGNYTLSEEQYFVLGDNRAGSADSRIWGPVPDENIVGRPFIRFFPPSILPGNVSERNIEASNATETN